MKLGGFQFYGERLVAVERNSNGIHVFGGHYAK